MKILLVRPPVPKFTIGLKHIMLCEPLELEYVAAGLHGHDIKIMDLIIEKHFPRVLKEFNPDVVGTGSYITGVNEVIKICRQAKLHNPQCLTVVGGVHASVSPADFADAAVDLIVLGDGTAKMREIVSAFAVGKPLNEIKGLALVKQHNKILLTPPCPYITNPDKLPFPRRDLLSHLSHKYYYLFHQPVTLVKTTWGCWYKCNFCTTWKVTGGVPFSRSPESIVNEISTILTKDVYIVDDIFLINPKRLLAIAALLKERKIYKKYLVYSRADFICENEDVIKVWAEVGLSAVIIGLEASTDPELDAMHKQCTVDYNRRSIDILRKYGVDTYGSLIPLPDYTVADWKRLLNFIFETGLYYVNISPLTPMPGTDIWEQYKDRITVSRKAFALWDLSHCILPTTLPLKTFYKYLLYTYAKTCLNLRRTQKLMLHTKPPLLSVKYFRIWFGAVKIFFQFLSAHKHHNEKNIRAAEDCGREFIPQTFNSNHFSAKDSTETIKAGSPV